MPAKQRDTRAACNETHLIVGGEVSKTVEVMNTSSFQWARVTNLPCKGLDSLVVCGEDIYSIYIHRNKRLFKCSTSDLIQSTQSRESIIWSELECEKILRVSTYLTVCGQLISIGGIDIDSEPTTAVTMYSSFTKKWEVIGHLNIPRSSCLAAALPNNHLFVVGGYTTLDWDDETNSVEIASIV